MYPTTRSCKGRTIIFGFGRVGRMVADMLREHDRPYLAVDSDIDAVMAAREAGYTILFGDVARNELVEKLHLGHAAALVLTMDDPVLVARIARRCAAGAPNLPIIARARDTDHAAELYEAGVTDAVPETLEASLQLSEAVLVDIGVAMGPVIASIHEKRSELRAGNHGRGRDGSGAAAGPAQAQGRWSAVLARTGYLDAQARVAFDDTGFARVQPESLIDLDRPRPPIAAAGLTSGRPQLASIR